MKKFIITLVLILSFIANSFGQNPSEPTVSTYDGEQKVCIKGNKHDLRVKINLPPGYDINKVDSFVIKWGYPGYTDIKNGGVKVIQRDKFNTIYNFIIDFKFPGIYSNCEPFHEGMVRLDTYIDGDPKNNLFAPTFLIPPTAKISDDSLITCVGQPFTFDGSKSCPTNITEYEWTIEGKKYYGQTYTHTFSTSGTKKVKLKVTNICGSDEDEIEINVKPLPEAVASTKANAINKKATICLNDNDKGKILLDGSNSKNASIYEWYSSSYNSGSVTFSDYANLLDLERHKKKWANFTSVGTYKIILEVNSDCNRPDYDTVVVEVIDRIPVYLTPINDTCGPIMYSPPTNVAGTKYWINNKSISTFPYQLKEGSYTIKAEYENECGPKDAEIKFKVFEPKETKISTPTNNIQVCKNPSDKIVLKGIPEDGIFSGTYVEKSGSGYVFIPKEVGIYTITLTSGEKACTRTDQISIEVIDNIPLTIIPQPDVCNSLSYTPGNYNNKAVYKINGQIKSSFPIILGPGIYYIEGTLSNACGDNQTVRDTFEVTTPQNVKILSPNKDTTVCKSNTEFELIGSHSKGVFSGSNLITHKNDKWYFTPSSIGTYTITFSEGVGACVTTASVKLNVIENQVLTITPQEDVCTKLSYSVKPNNIPGAVYTINGEVFTGTKELGVGKYEVIGTYENACGKQLVKDEFEVKPFNQIKINSPITNTIFCKSNDKIEIQVSEYGGTFEGYANIHEEGGKYYFTPNTIGDFTITYKHGAGAGCSSTDQIKIQIIDEVKLELTPQEDVCTKLSYSVKPNNIPGAVYTINGEVFTGTKELGVGKYEVIGTYENACGKQEVRDTFEVKPFQQVQISAPANESIFCLNDDKIELVVSEFGGSFSPNTFIDISNDKYFFAPSQIGKFKLTYSVGEGAGCSSTADITIEVIGENPLILDSQDDVCNEILYTPHPYNPSVTYFVNDIETNNFPVLLNNEGEYHILAKFQNACGEKIIKDTFFVTVPQDVKITSHSKKVTFCKTMDRQEITVSVPNGTFNSVNGFIVENDKYYFDPQLAGIGDFQLIYNHGIGDCNRADTLQIKVIESIPLTLPAQEDLCNTYMFTPKGFDEKAIYKINGLVIDNYSFPILLSEPKIYIVEAEMTNECGTLYLSDTFELFVPMNVKISSHPDDITVCASVDKIKIQGSTERGQFIPINELTILSTNEAELDVSNAGVYTIIFEQGFGDCYTSDTLIVTVENTKVLELTAQADACEVLDYTPNPWNEFAIYEINGSPITNVPMSLSSGIYIVKATLVDVCETKVLEDTFQVFTQKDLKIKTNSASRVCVNSENILLESTVEHAIFDGNKLIEEDGKTYFVPDEPGVYKIYLYLPLVNCVLKDSIEFEVIGLAPKIEDEFICQEMKSIILKGTPEGGVWTSATCPSCVDGDKFIFDGIHQEYHFEYTLTNDIGCIATDKATIYIISPISNFELSTPPCSSGIDFDLSKSIGQQYHWKIDGIDVEQPPFVGLSTGEHVITMISQISHCYDTSEISVFIIDPVMTAADFEIPLDEHCTPFLLQPVIHTPKFDYLEYQWVLDYNHEKIEYNSYDLGSGVMLINDSPFRKLAILTYKAGNVCGMVEKSDSIEIIGIPKSIIGIDSSRYGCSPYTIAMSNIAQGEMSECIWRVNGKEIRSCDPYIYQTFVANDTVTKFPIELEVSNECGKNISYDTITVSPPWIDVFFNTDEYEVCPNTPVYFEDATTPNPIYWRWSFGDGQFSDEQNPTIVFKTPGLYQVVLKASTGCGYDSITRPILVKEVPYVDFILPVYTCQNQISDSIINLSDYQNHKFIWDFGDGTLDSIHAHPQHSFLEFGVSNVSLTMVDKETQCFATMTKPFEVKPQPQIDIILDSLICYGKEVQVPNNTLYANDYTWYYDKVPVHTGKDALLIFKETGEHYIQLIATYNDKCVDSISKVVFVRRCDVYIPNVFTPNNDGKDDFFTAYGGVNTSMIRSIKIFDRWGEMVFSKNDYPLNVEYLGWDGSVSTRSKSYGINSAVFVYMIEVEFTDGTTEMFTGDVTLLR